MITCDTSINYYNASQLILQLLSYNLLTNRAKGKFVKSEDEGIS